MMFVELFEYDFDRSVGGLVQVELGFHSSGECMKSAFLGLVGFECVGNYRVMNDEMVSE